MKFRSLLAIAVLLLTVCSCQVAKKGDAEVTVSEAETLETETENTKAETETSKQEAVETETETTEENTTREPTARDWFETVIPYAWCEDLPVFMAVSRDPEVSGRVIITLNLSETEAFHEDELQERENGVLFYMCESGSIIEYCPDEECVRLTRDGERHTYFPDRSGYDFTKYYLLSSLGADDVQRIGRLFTVTCYDWTEESRKKYLYKEGYAYINIEPSGETWYYGGETVYVPGLTLVNKSGDGGPTLIVYFGDGAVHNVTIHDLWFDVENMPEITRTNADGSEYTDTTWKFLYWGIDGPVTADSEQK